ncbi:ribosome biogenesis regulatory protein homolog [Perognathus longimembris pacificus]|uniref:ribosome biogenesis regulatory protein homolog n=1 Tax=Perognathus longimembris pacificus TaxID=214514 RepID=UPI0020192DED|nr:ribosome biogenesis regulatory protein homolog [Perognathus longimembris pacificus]
MEEPGVEALLARAARDEEETRRRLEVHKELELEFDLGNLLAVDRNPPTALRAAGPGPAGEAALRALARDNAQLLVNRLWALPAAGAGAGEAALARLPEPATRLPRAKPAPRPRPLTRWQQFARLKGIRPRKRGSLAWDEASGEWRRRWGYRRARDDSREWLLEVPAGADPLEDQFARRRAAKRERVARNELNRLRNLARAHGRPPPPGAAGLRPAGHQSRAELGRALRVARASTASAGRFQPRLPREPPAPPGPGPGRKRRFRPVLGDFAAEKRGQLELLRVLGSKKPALDVTRAVHKQMREEDQEEAAKRRSSGRRQGQRRGGRPRPGGKGQGQGGPPGPGGKKKGGPGGKTHARPPGAGGKRKGGGQRPGGKRRK